MLALVSAIARLATALIYAIRTGTQDFRREVRRGPISTISPRW
jgi:nanoRNase/pAp phosphatase (c-di-AMP/oligoRNAs hydrolase)